MPFYDLPEFFALSRAINYNLNSTTSGRYFVLKYITNSQKFSATEKSVLMKALGFCINVYGDKRRRLGPPAVIHPLRAAALLARASSKVDILDLLTEMFHDLFEDIFPFDFESEKWRDIMALEFREILGKIGPESGDMVFNRLISLTMREKETYYSYIGRMLSDSSLSKHLIAVKLADRLDNTLDMRIDLQDPAEQIDFFQEIFEVLFSSQRIPTESNEEHPPKGPLNGAWRLFELFKNLVLLSLIRQNSDLEDEKQATLFKALAQASLSEAKRIFMHITGYHPFLVQNIREVLMEAMEYCHSGRINVITEPSEKYRMDGFFSTYFDHDSKKDRENKLDFLYQDKSLMLQASVCFTAIFRGFLTNSSYIVNGISSKGISPKN